MVTSLIFSIHVAATWMMVGVIWWVQLVHYPLFSRVGTRQFVDYEQGHVRRTGWVVIPVMSVELLTALALLLTRPALVLFSQVVWNLAILIVIWGITFLVQVPQHRVLSRGFDANCHAALVRWNWLRTLGWTARAGLLLWIFAGG